jgi:hypothetical protein
LQRPLLQMLIQYNPVIHSLYFSSCIHMAAFLFFLTQDLLHLTGQNSTTCTLVVDFTVYLESHLSCALTSVYNEMGSLRQKAEKWHEMNLQGRAQKGTVRFKTYVEAPKSKSIPKPLEKYRWIAILTC